MKYNVVLDVGMMPEWHNKAKPSSRDVWARYVCVCRGEMRSGDEHARLSALRIPGGGGGVCV